MSEITENKNFKEGGIIEFLKENGVDLNFILSKEKMKLCSSSFFCETNKQITEKYRNRKEVMIIGQVGGFYEIASLVGHLKDNGINSNLLFFDRKTNNIQNAIFSSLLIKLSKNKEEYILKLFGLSKIDVLKAFDIKKYREILKENSKELEEKNFDDESQINKYIEQHFIDDEIIKQIVFEDFSLARLQKYIIEELKYDDDKHYQILTKSLNNLSFEEKELFKKLATNYINYLKKDNNFKDFIDYLVQDIKRNNVNHILNNDTIFEGYKKIFNKNRIKFLPNIDISNNTDLEILKLVLKSYGIFEVNDSNKFPIDIAVIPHMNQVENAYQFLKEYVQSYIFDFKKSEAKKIWAIEPTITLNINTHKSIGAESIKEERDNRKPLKNLSKIDAVEGLPLISFISGANYGNIYNSEVDIENMIDMAISNKIDTMYIQGLFYSTYYHHQASRRLLTDPEYPTLDSRLKKARQLIKRLNDNNIKVVYQMGDEEYNLYKDLFDNYTREQKIKRDFSHKELQKSLDWVKPMIIQQLIPYMIRSGEDIVSFNTDEETKTKVTEVLNAIKAYNAGLPLGEFKKYINPKYLEDSENFRVVFNSVDKYGDRSIDLIENPNFSPNTQYGNPDAGLKKYTSSILSGIVEDKNNSQVIVDGRQGYMSLEVVDDKTILNVPQMINDEWYFTRKDLLPGIKNKILEDPTHKRVTQSQTKINSPGGWTISGDPREIQRIIPYFKRVREVMDDVQKTGIGLPELSVFHLNDTQLGSPTERITYFLKALDYFFYTYKARGIWGNGDYCQGWNYNKFANESRFLASMSVSEQMVEFVKLQRPWIDNAFGIVKNNLFELEDSKRNIKIDTKTNNEIIDSLLKNNLIKIQNGNFGNVYATDKETDYKKIDLKLPRKLKIYEGVIREKLSEINHLWFYHMVEGNHEWNTDWNNKGYMLIEHIKQELDNLNRFSGSNIEVKLSEYFINKNGDYVNAPYGSKTINGYNIAYGHIFRTPGKGSGGSPTKAMANYFLQMGDMSKPFHRAFMGHLHMYSTSVINNMMLSITGSSAGQSGYEQFLGYKSQPMYVIDTYLPDGYVMIDTIGLEFLRTWEIKNPYVAAIGLDTYIDIILRKEATIFGPDMPNEIHNPKVRKLVPGSINQVIGRKIS